MTAGVEPRPNLIAYGEFEVAARIARIEAFDALDRHYRAWQRFGNLQDAVKWATVLFQRSEDLLALTEAALETARSELDGVVL